MVNLLGELALTLDERIHLVRVLHHLRVAEGEIDVLIFLQKVHNLLHTLLNHFQDGLVGIHLRLLLQITDGIAGSPDHFALVRLLDSGNNLHQGRFTRTVQSDDSDFGSIEERKINILKDYFIVVREDLAHARH